jgi:hypothetical protein
MPGFAVGRLESVLEGSMAETVNDGPSSCASAVAAVIGHARNETMRKGIYFFGSKLFAKNA